MSKFYKLTNGIYTSQAIGFERVAVGAQSSVCIANQLDAPLNTLDHLFNPMPDGTKLPDGTQFYKWNGPVEQALFTWNLGAGAWSPNGNTTLAPGESGLLINSSDTAFTVTFVGLVREGQLAHSLVSGDISVASQIPLSGGISSVLGPLNPVDPVTHVGPLDGDTVEFWVGNQPNEVVFDSTTSTGFANVAGTHAVPEPQMAEGQGFLFIGSGSTTWSQNYSPIAGNVPALSSGQGQINSGSFAFNASGAANTAWTVYSSVHLQNWTGAGSLTLDGNGLGSFSDNGITGTMYKFYKVSNGTYTSQAIGFERVVVGPETGSGQFGTNALLADQLIQTAGTDNTLVSAFGQTSLPNESQVLKME